MGPQRYLTDLAYIHHAGFTGFAVKAGAGVLKFLHASGLRNSRVVELGCGSGVVSKILTLNGYKVHGMDYSRAMVRLARQNVPRARFSVGSLWRWQIPRCDAVVSVGECLNYQFEAPVTPANLHTLFSRVSSALRQGGVFLFDVLCETADEVPMYSQKWTEGTDWFVAVDRTESRSSITRTIICFRRTQKMFRRSVEVHRLRKHRLMRVIGLLQRCGFAVRIEPGYTRRETLGDGHVVVFATKS